jgi:hypothetical protein
MEFLSFPKLPNVAVTLGATSPVPADGVGSLLWSTTLGEILHWNGTVWGRPPGNAGAVSPVQIISVSSISALPNTYGPTDRVLAYRSDDITRYYWGGYYWTLEGAYTILDPTVAAQNSWYTYGGFGGTLTNVAPFNETTLFRIPVPGARPGMGNQFALNQLKIAGDNDEEEMDILVASRGSCIVDNFADFYVTPIPGPVSGSLSYLVGFL